MADFNSVQAAKWVADPRQAVKVNEWGGRVRHYYWSYVATGDEDPNETILLTRIPRGARLIGGKLVHGAHSTADFRIGTEDDEDRYLVLGDIATDGNIDFLDTEATNFGEELTEDTDIVGTVETGALVNGEILNGYILAVVD